MKIRIHGAAGGEVTGSAYLVQTRHARILVDCGMFQGGRRVESMNRISGAQTQRIDAVLITHGHLDHAGRLPLLAQHGFEGPVYATAATLDMTALILRDSARIQEGDAERQNRRRKRAGDPPVQPLYTTDNTEDIIRTFREVPLWKPVDVAPGVQAVFTEAGHMLGSSSIMLLVDEGASTKKVVFSGDLGPIGAPLLRDFEPFRQADLVFLESTYGDRNHRPMRETVTEFLNLVKHTVERGGKILIPTFAVGRAQLLTILMAWAFRNKWMKPFPMYLDSPMAIDAMNIYVKTFKRTPDLFDRQILDIIRQKPLREDLRSLTLTPTADESRAINDQPGPCMVMAGAGMCNAGRILHHLRNNLWKPETHVIFVGYQANGTLGRRLVDGEEFVKIHGEKVAVRGTIHSLSGFSAHAGQKDLLAWFGAFRRPRPRLVLTHGEDDARRTLDRLIREKYGVRADMPGMGETIQI